MQQKIIAEFFGTATLAFAILASLNVATPIFTMPVLAGLVLMLFVYSVGRISGSHLNPAITVGVWAINKIPTKEAIVYVVTQCLGAAAALALGFYLFSEVNVGLTAESYSDFWIQLIAMSIFAFSFGSVIYKKTVPAVTGLVIGGSFTLGIVLVLATGSTGILNPAVGISLGVVSLSNIAGSLFGAVIGMHMYRYLVR